MILYINTTKGHEIEIALREGERIVGLKKISAPYKQAEKLLPLISRLLKEQKIKIEKIKKIEVANKGGSFTALRIGVATANALGYGLRIPVKDSDSSRELKIKGKNNKFNISKPIYDREPNITIKS
jgi:tRNA A37 threonylcarbamoyladenosine modification protein TsaB